MTGAAVAHGEREHDVWSPSSAARFFACPGALALCEHLAIPDTSSFAADWGTANHQLIDKCMRQGKEPKDFLGTVEKTKTRSFVIDKEQVECAEEFVDYCRERIAAYKAETGEDPGVMIEEKVSLEKLGLPYSGKGTADVAMYFPKWGLIEMVDQKTGMGVVVEVQGNKQLRNYGMGVYLAINEAFLPEDRTTLRFRQTVVQPRVGHPDGRIRSETITWAEMQSWLTELDLAMQDAKTAEVDLADTMRAGPHEDEAFAQWADRYLSAGDHCLFCAAKLNCPAIRKQGLALAGETFEDLTAGRPTAPPDPGAMTPADLAYVLDRADVLTGFINACRARAESLVEAGVPVGNDAGEYVLVPKQSRRAWLVDDATVFAAVKAAGADPATVQNVKLMTPKQALEALGPKAFAIAGMSASESSGHNLVRKDKTARDAVPAHNWFKQE